MSDAAWTELRDLIQWAEAAGCTVGLAASGPDGAAFAYRADERFPAASTVKIPIMIAVYRAIDSGRLRLDDTYDLRDDDKVGGTGVLLHLRAGTRLAVDDLIYLMISISDNTATNALIGMVGLESIAGAMRELGLRRSTLRRLMTSGAGHPPERENWAAPGEYHQVMRAILADEAASARSCRAMLGMLEKQQCTTRLARYLPEDAGVRWGSKIGGLNRSISDVGFVMSDRGMLVLSMYCTGFPNQHAGEELLGRLARAAMRATCVVTPRSGV